MTTEVVQNGKLTNEGLGQIYRKVAEIIKRLNSRTITFNWVMIGLQEIIEGPAANVVKRGSLRRNQLPGELIECIQAKGFSVDERAIKVLQAANLDVDEEKEIVFVYPQELGLLSHDLEPRLMLELGRKLGLDPFPPGLVDELCEETDPMSLDIEILVAMELVHTDEDYVKTPTNGFALRVCNYNSKEEYRVVRPVWVATREDPKMNFPWAFVKTPKKK